VAAPKFKLKLTIEERILLHIRDYTKYEHNMQAPFALTQDGIAKAVSVVRSAIPRSMKKLVDKGIVNEQIGHVEGVIRRRKIYYLTTAGLMRAQEIIEKLEGLKCQARNTEGEVRELKISEINKFLGTDFSILELLDGLSENGVFDYPKYTARKAEAEGEKVTEEAFLAYIEKAPKLSFFIGRENELEKIRSWIDDPSRKVIVVHGIAGIGKTTLAIKIIDEFKSKKHLVWYSFHQWDTLRYFLKTISQFFGKLGRRELHRYLETEPIVDLNSIGEIIETALKELDVLLIIDDFHKAREEISPIFSLMLEILERLESTKMLIFSRNIIPFYDRRHVRIKKIVSELLLEGLSEGAAKELLEHRGLPGQELDSIYPLTGGHPLALELLGKEGDRASALNFDDMNMYIQEEIFSKVSEPDRDLLAYASVYRYGAPRDVLLEQIEGGFESLKALTSRALLQYGEGVYSVHDVIREFFYETLPASVRKNHHYKASQFYIDTIEDIETEASGFEESQKKDESIRTGFGLPKVYLQREIISISPVSQIVQTYPAQFSNQLMIAVIEGMYHLVYSERFQKAGELAASYGEYLIELDLSEELKELLEQIPLETLEDESQAMMLYHLGEIHNHLSDFEMAYYYFSNALEKFRLIHGESKDPKRMSLIYRRLGFIFERKSDLKQAKTYHEKSLELAEKAVDTFSVSDAYGALGWIYWNLGEHERANEYYNKCIDMADKISDMPGKAKLYLGICMTLAKRGELEEALEYYEKCLEILERNEDIFKLARSYEGMGDHYFRSIFSHFLQSKSKRTKK
jgi:tetratricopeptide (TPR) repeat protein/DNA-binding MarR family transcriptional regulator